MKPSLSDIATVVLTVCALTVTGLVVRKEFFQEPQGPDRGPREIREWSAVVGTGSVMGRPDAPVKIVEFSDFQCPFCARIQGTLEEIRTRYPDQVAVVYRHYPLEAIHPHAYDAALASACAEDQGRFAAYHDALYARQDSIGVSSWDRFAEIARVPDREAFGACVAERRHKGRVDEDVRTGARIGVRGTPTLIIDGTLVQGVSSVEELDAWVRKSLAD